MSCSIGCAKCLIIVFNIVYAILGIALASLGVIFRSEDIEYDESTIEVISTVDQAKALLLLSSVLFLVSGVVIILFAAYGCCAAIKEHTCLLKLYAAVLVIFCIVQISISIFAFIASNNDNALDEYKRDMRQSFNDYTNNTSVRNAFDHFQKKYSCCGVGGFQDYNDIQTTLPSTCCINTKNSCYLYDTANLQPVGCAQKQVEKVSFMLKTIGAISTVVAVLEAIGAILAYYLANTIRNEKRRINCT